MSIIARAKELKYPQIRDGFYQGVCFGVWDVGIHPTRYYVPLPSVDTNGGTKSDTKKQMFMRNAHKIIVAWELAKRIHRPQQIEHHRKRYVVIKTYTLSLNANSTLKKDLENWLGKKLNYSELYQGFDLEIMIGKNAILQIENQLKNTYTFPEMTNDESTYSSAKYEDNAIPNSSWTNVTKIFPFNSTVDKEKILSQIQERSSSWATDDLHKDYQWFVNKQILVSENKRSFTPEWVIAKRELALTHTWMRRQSTTSYGNGSKQAEGRFAAFTKLFDST